MPWAGKRLHCHWGNSAGEATFSHFIRLFGRFYLDLLNCGYRLGLAPVFRECLLLCGLGAMVENIKEKRNNILNQK
jgi:hypothetical protein